MKIVSMLVTTMAILSLMVAGCAAPGGGSGPAPAPSGAAPLVPAQSAPAQPETGQPSPAQPGTTLPATALAKGTLQILVTDAPPKADVTSVVVTVQSVEVHKTGAGEPESSGNVTSTSTNVTSSNATGKDDESGWMPIGILAGKATFDLLKIKGLEEVLATAELEAGKYTQIRMTIEKVQVKIGTGDLQNATLPSGKLKFVHPFEVVAGQATALLFDFDADQSVTVTGSDKVMVKPTIKLSTTRPKEGKDGKPSPAVVKITTASLPNGSVNVTYNATLTATGGTTPYTWSVDSGNLTSGLSLNSATGVISGIPAASGNSTFMVKVSDNSTPVKSDTKQLSIQITTN